jgi:hypothetical protein
MAIALACKARSHESAGFDSRTSLEMKQQKKQKKVLHPKRSTIRRLEGEHRRLGWWRFRGVGTEEAEKRLGVEIQLKALRQQRFATMVSILLGFAAVLIALLK